MIDPDGKIVRHSCNVVDHRPAVLNLVGNVAVGTMLVLMAYSVAYYGVLTPDRVVKHDMVHYLLRGPIVGIVVIQTRLGRRYGAAA